MLILEKKRSGLHPSPPSVPSRYAFINVDNFERSLSVLEYDQHCTDIGL